MRIDKFLNTTNILKRRSIAQDMCDSGVVALNGKPTKSSKEVKKGDTITLTYLEHTKTYEVLEIPTTKSVPKSQSALYVRERA
ncbi:RNA-binding S4 domain-containing protein [uncultured Helicobacter sp.]|uniref:RNA-binding S4 domain-containing protein n=1 Tax=uncultured Helicobacter sp. TaxID=175537 RepID=UPI0037537BBC